ncbi:MAG TPA: HAD-IA family hydrolase [Candidatus Binatia bacterium]
MATLAVFFDAAGTLIKTTNSVGQSYSSIAKNYGMRVAPAELFNSFRVCFDGAAPLAFPGAAPDTVSALEQDWWKQLVRRVFAPFGPFDRFDAYFDELFAYFARPESWELYPEAIETLRALRERGLKLAVVSNFDSRLCNILEGLGAASWFDGIFISSAVGYAKPDRRIFDFVIKSRQLVATSVLHVGDSVANDIGGAANAGMKALLVDRRGAHEADTIPRVASLNEIIDYLD